MDYLKAFTIGTSGLVTFSLLSDIAFDNKYNYSKDYSFIVPIFYGLMTILSVYIGKTFNLSLQLQLFIISIISFILVILFNYYVDNYKNYYEENKQDLLYVILRDIINQLIIFNIIIYYLSVNFSKLEFLRIFIIGSSIFSYLITYLKVNSLDDKKIIKYKFKNFSFTEPFIQGVGLVISLYILQDIFKLPLKISLLIFLVVFIPVTMSLINSYLKLYKSKGTYTVLNYSEGMILNGIIKYIPLYYLLMNLK